MVDLVTNVRSFANYVIFCELCDRMRFEVDCVKSHHRVISEGLTKAKIHIIVNNLLTSNVWPLQKISEHGLALLTLLSLSEDSAVLVGDFSIKIEHLRLIRC